MTGARVGGGESGEGRETRREAPGTGSEGCREGPVLPERDWDNLGGTRRYRLTGAERNSNRIVRNARFIIGNRMYSWKYIRQLYRFLKFKALHPGIRTDGFIFLPRHYEISKARCAEFSIGRFTWIGEGCAFRAHEGTLRIGRKCTFGGRNTINCYSGVDIGEEGLWADHIYVVDFDHWYIDPHMTIRSQGIRSEPIVIEPNVWIAEKATVLRGVRVGEGAVVGAMSLVTRDVPPYAVVGGVPARVLKYRRSPEDVAWDEGRY